MKSYIVLLRPKQWLKNMFVFLPMFFGESIYNRSYWLSTIFTFLAFCALSSAVYCINDVCDAKADRNHPTKSNRPIATGIISRSRALALAAILIATSLIISILFCRGTELILVLYLGLNIAYSLWLKRVVVADIAIVASGFVLRVIAGGIVTGIAVSNWIVVMVTVLTSFLVLTKRRHDALIDKTSLYSVGVINKSVIIMGVVTLILYVFYTVSEEVTMRYGSDLIYLTSIPVAIGLSRYMYITFRNKSCGDPTAIFYRDWIIGLCLAVWIVSFYFIIYK